jgi:hypothetical protein
MDQAMASSNDNVRLRPYERSTVTQNLTGPRRNVRCDTIEELCRGRPSCRSQSERRLWLRQHGALHG